MFPTLTGTRGEWGGDVNQALSASGKKKSEQVADIAEHPAPKDNDVSLWDYWKAKKPQC